MPFTGVVSDIAWCAAMVIFAFGIRGAGSVVAHDRVGVVALAVAGVAPLVFEVVWALILVPTEPTGPSAGLLALVSTAALVAVGVLAIVLASRQVSHDPAPSVQVYPPTPSVEQPDAGGLR